MIQSVARAALTPSAILLVLANMVPLVGVLFWDWSVFVVLLLFWMENVVYGVLNIPRILLSQGGGTEGPVALVGKLLVTLVFCIHYGIFTTVHGVFVVVMFGGPSDDLTAIGPSPMWHEITANQLQWVIVPLVVSHAFSFLENYIGKGEYRTTTLSQAMNAPYSRVIALHITILFGGFLVMSLGDPVIGVVLLVVLKTIMDLRSHIAAHRRSGASQEPAPQA
ncbi:DUF6498-containing protein [Thiorhodococcus minor]|uniref:Uncharacterized protein n=1 Tax=Thiorhodococcus minor TaxID=57489 RepID=A0A6M0K3R5_9GAMM|nr:DUF6498-containing protein [Thiorhodococcus minor]NEV64416.1 hypothetical protein [Thiorhodococcus minor]